MSKKQNRIAFVISPCCNAHGKLYYKCDEYPNITTNLNNARHYTEEEAAAALSESDLGMYKVVYDTRTKNWHVALKNPKEK